VRVGGVTLGCDRSSAFCKQRPAGISPRHLDRLFLTHRRESFLDTYRAIRLVHGRRLLEQSPLPIAENAYATGFSRAFKAVYGQTPATARR
jgi:AraC family transcriptional regulator, glycine betaine-responsive activator